MPFQVFFGWTSDSGVKCVHPPNAASTSIELQLALEPLVRHGVTVDREKIWAFGSCFPTASLTANRCHLALETRLTRVTPDTIGPPNGAFYMTLALSASHDLLEGFEAQRGETSEVELSLHFNLILIPLVDLGGTRVLGPPHMVPESEIEGRTRTFPRDEWHELLRELRFSDVMVFEFPQRIVGEADSPVLRTARAEMDKARRAFDDHHTDAVAHHAYLALDALAPGPGGIIDRIDRAYFETVHPEARVRLKNALVALLPTIQVGRHMVGDAKQPMVPVTREHAKWIYSMTSLVVGWCGTLRR